jgi:hypothetical protein
MSHGKPRFLLYGGPLEDLFSAALEPHGTLSTADGDRSAAEYDLLVLHSPTIPADRFGVAVAAARSALDADKPVLVLSPNVATKAALAAQGALTSYPQGSSVALLIEPRRHASGQLSVVLSEQYAPNQLGGTLTRTLGGENVEETVDVFPLDPPASPTIMDLEKFVARVRSAVVTGRSGGQRFSAGDGVNPPGNIPAGLFSVTPVNLYYPVSPGGWTQQGYTCPTATLYFEGTVSIGVYYDNLSFNTPVQWLFVDHSGLYYTNGLVANDNTHIGWSIGYLQIQGEDISSPTITTKTSSPNNVNNQSQYTTGTSFTVGVSAGTDGLGVNASYTISSSVTQNISDWGILQNSPNWWVFWQQVPYDGRPPGGSFPSGAAGSDGVNQGLPTISQGSLAYETQTAWMQQPATNQNSSVFYSYYWNAFFTYSSETGKSWSAYCWYPNYGANQTYTIGWSAAWPSTG